MKRAIACLILLAGCIAAAHGEQGSVAQYRFYGSWRSLGHRLPGAYRFIDRLNLTEEQQELLGKVYQDWASKRREAYAAVMKQIPSLSAEERKDPEKVKAYYAKRSDLLRKAQTPPDIDLVTDILTEPQLAKIQEAGKVLAALDAWLADHLAQYDKKLDALLGPVVSEKPQAEQYRYQMFEVYLKGGALLGRLGLTEQQDEALQGLRKRYYAEFSRMLAPLSISLANAKVSYTNLQGVRSHVGRKGGEAIRHRYREQIKEVLTKDQQALLEQAVQIVEERDKAVWERYSAYLLELEAILPYRGSAPGQANQGKKPN